MMTYWFYDRKFVITLRSVLIKKGYGKHACMYLQEEFSKHDISILSKGSDLMLMINPLRKFNLITTNHDAIVSVTSVENTA
jgi:hypothetical protein